MTAAELCTPALHQPVWTDKNALSRARCFLTEAPPLVDLRDVLQLQKELEDVCAGRAVVLQAGDCAETFNEMTPAPTMRKLALTHRLADEMESYSGLPAIRVGRIAGQFAKPRTVPSELIDGIEVSALLR